MHPRPSVSRFVTHPPVPPTLLLLEVKEKKVEWTSSTGSKRSAFIIFVSCFLLPESWHVCTARLQIVVCHYRTQYSTVKFSRTLGGCYPERISVTLITTYLSFMCHGKVGLGPH